MPTPSSRRDKKQMRCRIKKRKVSYVDRDLQKAISLLHIERFNELSQRSMLQKDRIVEVDAPDPSGQKGRARKWWRYRTAGGKTYYSETAPTVDDHHDPEKGKHIGEYVKHQAEEVSRELLSGSMPGEDGARTLRDLGNRAAGKMRELNKLAQKGSPEADSLKEALKHITEFSEKLTAAGSDPKKLSEAVSSFKEAADKIHEAKESLEDSKKPEGEEGSPEQEAGKKNEIVYGKSELGTAPWEEKIEEIEKGMLQKTKERSAIRSDNINGSFIDISESGHKMVFKPKELSVPVDASRRTLRREIGSEHREVAGFELDRILGFGVVPPTFMRDSDVSDSDILALSERNARAVSGRRGGKMSGSAQHYVKGTSYGAMEVEHGSDPSFTLSNFYKKMSSTAKFNMQKLAIFDHISGNTDRHSGNIFLDGDNVYAIDQGLCFPDGDNSKFNSRPLAMLKSSKEKIDPRIMKRLQKVDRNKIVAMMKAHGMESESRSVLKRLEEVLKSGGNFELV